MSIEKPVEKSASFAAILFKAAAPNRAIDRAGLESRASISRIAKTGSTVAPKVAAMNRPPTVTVIPTVTPMVTGTVTATPMVTLTAMEMATPV